MNARNEATRTCVRCGEVKPAPLFVKGKSRCKQCDAMRCRDYRERNKEAVAKRDRARKAGLTDRKRNKEQEATRWQTYYGSNRETLLARDAEYRKANGQAIAAKQADRIKRLTPGYIASLIGVSLGDAPPELIELKREQVAIHRLTKQLTTTLKEHANGTE